MEEKFLKRHIFLILDFLNLPEKSAMYRFKLDWVLKVKFVDFLGTE